MFRRCRRGQTVLALALSLAATLSACSRRDSTPAPAAETPSSVENTQDAEPADVLKASATAAGVRTKYAAYFDNGQLTRITETREPAGNGEYVFYGARLTQYKGAALDSPANIELTFDLHSGVAGNAAALADGEISAIRNRAELLRSLALSRRSTLSHTSRQ